MPHLDISTHAAHSGEIRKDYFPIGVTPTKLNQVHTTISYHNPQHEKDLDVSITKVWPLVVG